MKISTNQVFLLHWKLTSPQRTLREFFPPKMYVKGSYFWISVVKKHFSKQFYRKNIFYYAKGIKLNDKIIKIKNLSKLFKFIVQFNSFCIIKNICTNKVLWKDASIMQELKNQISSCTFPMKAIPSVFDEIKLTVYENGKRLIITHFYTSCRLETLLLLMKIVKND